jgi:hypothetical protein
MAVGYASQEANMEQAARLPLVSVEEAFWRRQQLFSQEILLVSTSIFSVILSLPQRDINIPRTFKFVTAAFNYTIVAPSSKFNISTSCHCQIIK